MCPSFLSGVCFLTQKKALCRKVKSRMSSCGVRFEGEISPQAYVFQYLVPSWEVMKPGAWTKLIDS